MLCVLFYFLYFINFILSSFQEKEPEAANGKFTQISSTFFGFLKNLEKKVCDLWDSFSLWTKRAILGISVLLFLIILIALIGVASTGSSCDTGQKISKEIFPCLQFFQNHNRKICLIGPSPRVGRCMDLVQTHKCSLLTMGPHVFQIKLC